jgi:hypothetical protein
MPVIRDFRAKSIWLSELVELGKSDTQGNHGPIRDGRETGAISIKACPRDPAAAQGTSEVHRLVFGVSVIVADLRN